MDEQREDIQETGVFAIKDLLHEANKFWKDQCDFDQRIEKSLEQLLEVNKEFDIKSRLGISQLFKQKIDLDKAYKEWIDSQSQIKLKENTNKFIEH